MFLWLRERLARAIAPPPAAAVTRSEPEPPVAQAPAAPPLDRDSIFYKSLMVAWWEGWYLEFGVYRGHTFHNVYYTVRHVLHEFRSGFWNAGLGPDKEAERAVMNRNIDQIWEHMRFVAFDSFAGIPGDQSAVDSFYPSFQPGSYACSEAEFLGNMTAAGVDLSKVITVPGFYDQTLTPETAARIGLQKIAIAHIDSDLYSSAKLALDFCTPYFRDGSIVIFDEWFQYPRQPLPRRAARLRGVAGSEPGLARDRLRDPGAVVEGLHPVAQARPRGGRGMMRSRRDSNPRPPD